MSSSSRERLEHLERLPAIDRVPSGSRASFQLRMAPGEIPLTIDAIRVLARRGLTLLQAKRAVEAMLDHGQAVADLPTVEDAGAAVQERARAGVLAQVEKALAPAAAPR